MNPGLQWDWEFAWMALPRLLSALKVTAGATLGGMALALVLGLVLALLRRSHLRAVSVPAACFIEFIRSTPLLVQLYFLFYVLDRTGALSPLWTGVVALGVHYSTYTAEVYRAGLEAVPKGQWEACTALNLEPRDTLRHVIIPQAIPPIVPALGNYFVAMFKDTPLLSAITVMELLNTATQEIGAEHFRYLEPVTIVGVLFLLLSLGASQVNRWIEKKLRLPSR
jgi:polar amino acid transport system permease protein